MDSKEIKPGDLVMVARATPCCRNAAHIGEVFVVKTVGPITRPCRWCGADRSGYQVSGHWNGKAATDRLIKIDPPADGETREAYKNLKEPA